MKFHQARRIAECWVEASTQGAAVLDREKTLSLPYGWVFFYNAAAFIANRSLLEASLVGNVPFLIERVNGDLRVLGPHYKDRLRELESAIPAAVLDMSPEPAQW